MEPPIIKDTVIDIQQDQQILDGCGSGTPFFFIRFIILVVIACIILAFSIFMIISHPELPNAVYFSLISVIIGIFSPSPSSSKK